MNDSLGEIIITLRSGQEHFHDGKDNLEFTLLDYWQWSTSDLLDNTTRGIIAEFLVARDLGVTHRLRVSWAAYDLETSDGVKVEIKSAAYIQSWHQKAFSKITFSIRSTFEYDEYSGAFASESRRQSDVYVFALLNHRDKRTVDPLNVSQWDFYVLPTKELDQHLPLQKQIGLTTLLSLKPIHATFGDIRTAIEQSIVAV